MATTTITANATTRRPAEITKASYAPLAVLALAQIGTSSDSAAMNLATASLVGTLGATLDDIQMATTLFSLIAGAFMIAGGLVGVTIGLRRALAMGLSLAVAGEMVAALSPNIFAFTWGGRVIMGLGACLITPSVLGLVAALYQGRQRAIAFGTIAGAAALSTLSPLILGIVMDSSGFRLTFAIMAIYFVLVLCCTRLVPRTPLSGNHSHFDVAGTIVAALGMGLALFGVAHLSDWGIVNPQKLCPFTLCGLPPTLPAILIGLVLLGLLVPTERRAQRRGNPLIPPRSSPRLRFARGFPPSRFRFSTWAPSASWPRRTSSSSPGSRRCKPACSPSCRASRCSFWQPFYPSSPRTFPRASSSGRGSSPSPAPARSWPSASMRTA